MKQVKVLIPFHMIATNTDHEPGEIIEVSEEQLAKIRAVNVNMVLVLADVEEPAQDEEPVEEPAQDEEPVEEPAQDEEEKPKKRKTKKQ